MKRILVTTLLIAAGSLTTFNEASADHERSIRRDYEIRRVELEHERKARREANRFAYHRERDLLRAERARAARIDCPKARSMTLRAIGRETSALARRYNAANRDIAGWHRAEMDAWRHARELALRTARTPVIVERPVLYERPVNVPMHSHPADCRCVECLRPASPVIEAPYGYGGNAMRRDVHSHDVYESNRIDERYSPATFRRSPNTLDWTSLILSLLN